MKSSHLGCFALLFAVAACGGSSRHASSPHGTTTITAAKIGPRIEKLVVIEPGSITLVAREGCLANVETKEGQAGSHDALSVRCPKPERMKAWLEGASQVTSTLSLTQVEESDDDDADDETDPAKLPSAKLLTTNGRTFKVTTKADIEKLAREVHALSAELATAEKVGPGPASAEGWQMLHVNGAAHVMLAGAPTRGAFEAKVSTNGQYLCEFVTNVGDGPLRASKSGWLKPSVASRAIDEVLRPWSATGANERSKTTFAAGIRQGSEERTTTASTAEVFERFAQMQNALGDACLPELEPPAAANVSL